jgi:hypothetical protein
MAPASGVRAAIAFPPPRSSACWDPTTRPPPDKPPQKPFRKGPRSSRTETRDSSGWPPGGAFTARRAQPKRRVAELVWAAMPTWLWTPKPTVPPRAIRTSQSRVATSRRGPQVDRPKENAECARPGVIEPQQLHQVDLLSSGAGVVAPRSSADKPFFGTSRSRPNFCDRFGLGARPPDFDSKWFSAVLLI